MRNDIEKDLWDWITGYIEVASKFYNYKFPPCPFAKAARLKGLVDVAAYTNGSAWQFIQQKTTELLTNEQHHIQVLAFPSYMRWNFWLHYRIRQLNKKIIPQDFYAQYGRALKTQSKYPVDFRDQPYFICIVNKLSAVLAGHETLKNTDYYKNWSTKHYNEVVTRRQDAYIKFKE